MAFWYRVNNSKIKTLSIHLQRCYFQCNVSNSLIAGASLSNSNLTIPKSPFEYTQSVRCFAAPVQAKTRKEEKDTSGPRLNREITADIVRLVVDEGHRVVSIREAWELAKSLNLDLVEVSRNAKPPVCKIMDYHKEQYQQQLKDSAKKSKSELTLKKGDCKEVRFVGKIEKKDLQIKADTVKRMMERGYRVKCTAMSMGNEGEDLGAVLSRFSPLIEDVAYIESGPRVEKKQAYIVVRHVKFGPSKKGSGKKASKEYKTASSAEDADSVAPESSLKLNQNCDAAESRVESDDDSCLEEMTDEDDATLRSANVSSDFAHDSSRAGAAVPLSGGHSSFRRESGNTLQGPSGEEIRYRRDPINTPIHTKSVPSNTPGSRSTKIGDTLSDIGRQLPQDRSTLSHTRDHGSQFLRKSPLNVSPEQHPSHSSGRSSPSSGFGIFSSPQADRTPGNENNVATQNRYKKSEQFNSGRNSNASDPRRPDLGRREGQGKYPIFGDSSNVKPNHNSETQR
ncbi:translation initiation factor IF3-1, mitochondrial [Lycium barbarum]|uniref:translation initiation factor IF3-1, mitochondrial n=1 Tax=Lycium barbarum TaxID=112863 RepID=UPI00293E3B24|nr:translation initiation factor IF3-1, mitochondrial [Lycium barbarum]